MKGDFSLRQYWLVVMTKITALAAKRQLADKNCVGQSWPSWIADYQNSGESSN